MMMSLRASQHSHDGRGLTALGLMKILETKGVLLLSTFSLNLSCGRWMFLACRRWKVSSLRSPPCKDKRSCHHASDQPDLIKTCDQVQLLSLSRSGWAEKLTLRFQLDTTIFGGWYPAGITGCWVRLTPETSSRRMPWTQITLHWAISHMWQDTRQPCSTRLKEFRPKAFSPFVIPAGTTKWHHMVLTKPAHTKSENYTDNNTI